LAYFGSPVLPCGLFAAGSARRRKKREEAKTVAAGGPARTNGFTMLNARRAAWATIRTGVRPSLPLTSPRGPTRNAAVNDHLRKRKDARAFRRLCVDGMVFEAANGSSG